MSCADADLSTSDGTEAGRAPRRARRRPPAWSPAVAPGLAGRLEGAAFAVKSVERKPYRRSPYAPFRTTTLQQEASRKLGFSAKYTMSTAQRLYENGHITYMRTDSIDAVADRDHARPARQASELYGAEYVPDAPRVYTSKVKNAQEAHEAIRPAGDRFRTPAQTGLSGDEFRLYELIWKRTVASQMKDATGESVVGPDHRARPSAAKRPSSPRPARSSPSTGSSRPTSRTSRTTPTATTASAACRRWPRATR